MFLDPHTQDGISLITISSHQLKYIASWNKIMVHIISVNVCLYGASAFIIQVKDFLLNQVLELNGIFKSHSFKTRLSIYWIRKGEKRSFPVNLFSLLLFKELIQINIEQCATYYQCYLVFYYVFSHQILMIISKPI